MEITKAVTVLMLVTLTLGAVATAGAQMDDGMDDGEMDGMETNETEEMDENQTDEMGDDMDDDMIGDEEMEDGMMEDEDMDDDMMEDETEEEGLPGFTAVLAGVAVLLGTVAVFAWRKKE